MPVDVLSSWSPGAGRLGLARSDGGISASMWRVEAACE